MSPRRLRLAVLAAEIAAVATLARSIAYDRWITVLAASVLLVGALAARRQRTWGVGLALGAAASFPVAFLVGIAPAWFVLVGIAGALPFLATSRALARFDARSTAFLATLAAAVGAACAWGWKQIAWSVFEAVPALGPGLEASHGVALGVLGAIVAAVVGRRLLAARQDPEVSGARVRVDAREPEAAPAPAELAEIEDELEAPARRRARI